MVTQRRATTARRVTEAARQAAYRVTHPGATKPVYIKWQASETDQSRPYAWKIGISNDPVKTRSAFDRGNALPVHTVGTVPGGKPRETALHALLAEHRIPTAPGNNSREWFYDHPDVRAVVDELCAEAGVVNPHPLAA